MFKFSQRKTATFITILIFTIIFISISFILIKFYIQKKQNNASLVLEKVSITPINTTTNELIVNQQYKNYDWRIKISKINLDAPILEGTQKEILRRAVGHFETTNVWNGNVCLAAHNRGYKYSYFGKIKNLELGDIIIYQTEYGERQYEVISNKVIEETDWSVIENTKENKLTLITCEENKREYRRCIQAKEI